ncbi:MAG: hypothetical protein JETT_3179 [Candidatus Jettenia ecosi]|uniref:Uncharacterized protein n=1 Tax=Candidatus Jettenia ecosi TaxID=2494326 RepID=A0A533Q7E4_9BACT|nr:MAG: hypothetical protein JETT_3179 [Candidatus Jettenia ecosi]
MFCNNGMILTIFPTLSNSGSPVITGRFISFASSIQKASAKDKHLHRFFPFLKA